MICPNCPGNVEMVKIDEHSQCPICNGQWWEGEKPERGPYKKVTVADNIFFNPKRTDIDYKPPLPAGVPVFKGGGKSGRKRKKPVKKDIRVAYET